MTTHRQNVIVSTLTILAAFAWFNDTASAQTVFYDFEQGTTPSTTTIEDQNGPPFTNFTVETDRLVSFRGGTGLFFDGTAAQAVNLGHGVDDELLAPLTLGLRVEADFIISGDPEDGFPDMVLAGMDDASANRSWQLRIFRTTAAASIAGRISIGLNTDVTDEGSGMAFMNTGTGTELVRGTNYRVIAEWLPDETPGDPETSGFRSISLWNLDTDTLVGSNTGSIAGTSLVFPEDVDVVLGATFNDATLFQGTIGSIAIIAIPEPTTHGLFGLAVCLAAFLRRRSPKK